MKAPRREKQIARELIYGPIGDWLKVTANILKNADTAFFLYPFSKLQEFEKYCSEYNLNISELWPLSPSKLKEPDVFIAKLKQKIEEQSTCHHNPIFRDEADKEIRKLNY